MTVPPVPFSLESARLHTANPHPLAELLDVNHLAEHLLQLVWRDDEEHFRLSVQFLADILLDTVFSVRVLYDPHDEREHTGGLLFDAGIVIAEVHVALVEDLRKRLCSKIHSIYQRSS